MVMLVALPDAWIQQAAANMWRLFINRHDTGPYVPFRERHRAKRAIAGVSCRGGTVQKPYNAWHISLNCCL